MAHAFIALFFFLNSLSLLAATAFVNEAPRLSYLKPVEIVSQQLNNQSNNVGLIYERACGEAFRGIFIRQLAKGALEVGVVVDRSDKYCSSLPAREQVLIPMVNSNRMSSIRGRVMTRIILVEALDVTVSDSSMSVSWQDGCAPTLGMVVSPAGNSDSWRVGINMAQASQASSSRSTLGVCARDVRRMTVAGLHFWPEQVQVNSRPGQILDLYALRVKAPVKINVAKNGSLAVTWEYSCREEPVGVLFTGNSGLDVGVVSVIAPNRKCEPGSKDLSKKLGVITVEGLVIAPGQKITSLTNSQVLSLSKAAQFKYGLKPVSSIKLARHGSGDWMLARSSMTCSDRLGLVAGKDSHGNLALASLSAGGRRTCHVSQSLSATTLTAPLVGPEDGPMPKVFGLKVFGTAIN